ncbi:L-threonylcarbamoyladenylate synthase [Leptolyngbya sp. GB1-A1]|uniref:L-threonylcarbamoyladenylate synthase n=2 Tax=Leptolyngbya TaxID=47251 RepID=UPI001994A5F6|nr:L-threonylcarbamoyladenylate synthase [Cyanobacteria bacterium FACHB-502]
MPQVSFDTLIEAARSGTQLISFPTDTVPALASRPDRASLIYDAKQRSETKPLILMGSDIEDLWDYVVGTPEERSIWQETAAQYLPGALTLVLPASEKLPRQMNPTDPTTIGIRVPDHPVARDLLRQTGPLATTSVNRSGEPALRAIEDINTQFSNVLTFFPEQFRAIEQQLAQTQDPDAMVGSGLPSTVVKWTGIGWKILRQGTVRLA